MGGAVKGFSGSYAADDTIFLLKPVTLPTIDVAKKEAMIQSGRKHYSEMLSFEHPPAPAYMQTFYQAFAENRAKVGEDVAALAKTLADREGDEVVLVSLARAGTPIGALLRRALAKLDRKAVHYSVSIIRNRGLDAVAMGDILSCHKAENTVFVDGWTGKGAIAQELASNVAENFPSLIRAPLCVLSDLAGIADIAANNHDYVIPSAILNGIISGLVSRTILSDDVIDPGDYHGCVILDHLADQDISRWYLDEQMKDVEQNLSTARPVPWNAEIKADASRASQAFVREMSVRTGVKDRNRIKPGVGESTRALLRRMPERLFVRDPAQQDLRHLINLAAERGIIPEIDPGLLYSACAIIKTMGNE